MANVSQLTPDSQFPAEALQQSVQSFPKAQETGPGSVLFTWNIASAADAISPWGKDVKRRDQQLRTFWPTETYLAGAVVNRSFRNTTLDWEIQGPENVAQKVTDMLLAAIAEETFGWGTFMQKFSQDLLTQDNGAFIEVIRDPGMDAASPFKGAMAPVLGIAHLDSNACQRTGDPEYPVVYTDRDGRQHKLAWYQVIPFADFPSAIQSMNGVGYSSVTRALRVAQIMRSVFIFKDEKISGRHYKQIHFVSGVSRQDIKDEMVRGQEEANSTGLIRFIMPAILASLDPEKPVSTASIDLASLPEGFDFDQELKWYISGLALSFGVDYQEFAPLPGGNIGSSAQSVILHRKSTAKGPGVFMRTLTEAFKNYGVLPRNCTMRFNDKDEQEELERQEVRTKAVEEAAIIANSQILSREAVAKMLVRRGIYEADDVAGLEEFWKRVDSLSTPSKQAVGYTGGNTIAQDVTRQETQKPNPNGSDNLLKEREERKGLFDLLKAVWPRPQRMVKEKPPEVNVEVHNHPGEPPIVNVTNEMKAQKAPVVNVRVPRQEPPIVNVTPAQVKVDNVVNVPAQPPPTVNVAPAQVKVDNVVNVPPRPKNVAIEYENGKPVGLKAE